MNATVNPAPGNDSAPPSDVFDNLADMDLDNLLADTPTKDQVKAPAAPKIDPKGETDEVAPEANQEAEETATEAPVEEGEEFPEIAETAKVKLQDGTAVSLAELKAGYMKDADYRLKGSKLATEYRQRSEQLGQTAQRLTQVSDAITEYLAAQIPPEPDYNLSFTDPAAHYRATVERHQALARVQQIIEASESVKQEQTAIAQQDYQARWEAEQAALVQKYPRLSDPKARETFLSQARSAAKELGFQDEVIDSAVSHQELALAYYASLGLQVEKAKATAQTKVAAVPPVTPQNKRGLHPNSAKALANVNAMKRFNENPSIATAMDLDF
jgi:hypothetical protein